MVKISLVVFLLVLQLLLVAVLLAVFALFKIRQLSARLARQRAAPGASSVSIAGESKDIAQYLAVELQRARGRLENQGGATPGAGASASSAGRLALRVELLQIEEEWARHAEHDDAAWSELDERLRRLLAQDAVAPLSPAPSSATAGGSDVIETKVLFDEQHMTIEQLKADIAATGANPEATKLLQAKLDKLGRTARELTFCVSILEDENLFLRDQVQALLQQE